MSSSLSSSILSLDLQYSRPGPRSEITAVAFSPSSSAAYAIYAAPQTQQSWIDIFDLRTKRGFSKIGGAHALFGPLGVGNLVATLRAWTVQLGSGVEYHHASSVMVRDFATGKTTVELKEARGEPVAWSADGKLIAADEGRERVGIWDVRSGVRVGRVVSHIDTITHAAFTPDNNIVTLSRDGTLRITDPRTSRTLSRLVIESSSNPRALAISRSGGTIISVWGNTVHIWLPEASHLTSYNLTNARGSEGWPLCISPDCRYMACWTEQGFDIVDAASGTVICERNGGALVTAGAFSVDGDMLILGRLDGAIELWDMDERKM